MNPVAVLSVLVKAVGVSEVNAQLAEVEANGRKAAGASDAAAAKMRTLGTAGKAAAAGAAAASAETATLSTRMQSAGRSMQTVGGRMKGIASAVKGPTVALVGMGVAAGKLATDFQRDMEMVHTQAGAAQSEVDKLKGKVLDLARVMPQSPDELAKGLFHIESVGLRGAKAMDALKIAAKGAAVGNSDLEDTATALGSAWLVNIKGAGNLQHVMGLVNATVGAGNMRMQDLVHALGVGLLPAAKNAGLSIKDVFGAMAVFTDEGYRASSAAAQFSTALHFLYNPTTKAGAAMNSIGLKSDQLAKDMHKPQGLLVALRDLKTHLSSLSKVQQEEVLGRILPGGQGRIMLTLLNQLDRYQMKLGQVGKGTKRFNEDFAKTQQTASFKFKAAWSSIQVALIKAGNILLPILASIAQAVAKVADWFSKLPAPVQKVIVIVGLVVAVLGTLLTILAPIIISLGGLTVAIGALEVASLPISGTVLIIVAALAALGVGLMEAWKHSATFRDVVLSVWSAVKTGVLAAVNAVRVAVMAVWHALQAATKATWGVIGGAVKAACQVIGAVVKITWDTIKTITVVLWDFLKPFIKTGLDLLTLWFKITFRAIEVVVQVTWAAVKALSKAFWNTFGPWLKAAWEGIKAAATAIWKAIKVAIVNPVGDAVNWVIDHVGGFAQKLANWWGKILGGVRHFAGNISNAITGAFEGAVNLVIGFVNKIIDVVNKIPGVNIKHIGKVGGGGSHAPNVSSGAGGVNHAPVVSHGHKVGYAKGGAFARTGGLVGHPMVFMGEEAPTHPEFIIPTNPAYRSRAIGLLGQAAGALGFAQGGQFSFAGLENLWRQAGGSPAAENTMAWIAEAESGGWPLRNNGDAPPGGGFRTGDGGRTKAAGLWQILGLPFPGNVYDPLTNAKMAKAKSANGRNLGPWAASRSVWGPHLGHSGGGLLGSIGHILGTPFRLLAHGAGALLHMLPNPAKLLPGWLKGLGSYAISHVGGWIKDKVSAVLSAINPFGGGGSGPKGTGIFDGHPVAKWIIPELQWAHAHGWKGHITSGYRPPNQVVHNAQGLVAPLGHSEHNLTQFPGGAIDVGDPGDRTDGAYLWSILRKYPGSPKLIWGGPTIGDWGHFSGTGHKTGGVWGGVLGSYASGTPFVPATGPYLLHRGERVVTAQDNRANASRPMLNVEGDLVLQDGSDLERTLDRLAFRLG